MMLAHFLALADAIAAQVTSAMPGAFRWVGPAADLAGVKDSLAVTPACHILLASVAPGAQIAPGQAVAWDQDWLTVVVTRSAKDPKSGAGAMALAGPLCGSVIAALAGWQPADGCTPLAPVSPGAAPLVTDAGTLYVPLAWRSRITQWSA